MTDWAENHGSDITQYEHPEAATSDPAVEALTLTPLAGGFIKHGINNLEGIGDMGASDVAGGVIGAMAGVADFGLNVQNMHGNMQQNDGSFNPTGMLVGLGISALLTYIEPLDDLLKEVSGDAGAMGQQIDDWEMVRVALEELSNEVATESQNALQNWGGSAAEKSAGHIEDLCKTIMGLSKGADSIQQVLAWAQAMANLIYGVIKQIIVDVITDLINQAIAALASSTFTFGGSIAAFLVSAAQAIGRALLKALTKVFTTKEGYGTIATIISGTVAGSVRDLFNHGFSSGGDEASSTRGSLDVGLAADLEEFTTASNALKTQSSNASSIREKIDSITAEDMSWGICGLFFSDTYNENTSTYAADVDFISTALDDSSGKMERVRENYEETDRKITKDLQAIRDNTSLTDPR
ncbi:hypothetical protein [Haloglycomyces albus]|uniref:hypothetical protein n=1 Tax=Haloglycomyces albus TaxID=526067 RepID=UPI00046D7177|nr:hypothetical protein [Haloglycomyces albus]